MNAVKVHCTDQMMTAILQVGTSQIFAFAPIP